MNLSDLVHRAVQRQPDKIATICGERRRTWVQVSERIARLGGALQKLGLQRGERVSLLALNSDRYLETYFAVPWADGVIVPMNTRWSVSENLYSIQDSTPKILMVDDHFVSHATALVNKGAAIERVIYMGEGGAPDGMLHYETILSEAQPIAPGKRGDDDLAGIFYTGGTTGYPKGVMLSYSSILHAAIFSALEVGSAAEENDLFLQVCPLFHMAGLCPMLTNVIATMPQYFLPSFEPRKVLETISAHRITETLLVPTMMQMMFEYPEFPRFDISSLRRMFYAASPMPMVLQERVLETLPQLRLVQAYGQTEMSPLICVLRPIDHQLAGEYSHRRKSVGRPYFGVEVKIVNDSLAEVLVGEIGQIAARGKNAMLGYWNKPEQTAATLVDGWVLTGDAGYKDEDGFIYLVDRVKDIIISGGENVFSVEVENTLQSHPDVEVVSVIGIPHMEWGEAVHAVVICKSGCSPTEQQLIQHCKERIAGYKCPKSITFRTEPMPLSAAGKILKTELRKPFWEGVGKAIN